MRWTVPLPPLTGDEAADLAAFAAWETARERHFYPGRFDADGVRLPVPRSFEFYLGVPEPSWLGKLDVGPDGAYLCVGHSKFISAARLARYCTDGERWPVRSMCSYAIDSGAYIALTGRNKDVPWFANHDEYGGMILRFIENNGYPPDFVAPQDYPCEDAALAATGLTVRQHLDFTIDSFVWLEREFPMVPWIPVLQGKDPGDHAMHATMYADRGIDLASYRRVGVGSICRLTELDGLVERIGHLEDLAAAGLRLHGFGLKTSALPLVGHLLASADSMAWSAHVRRNARTKPIKLPGCTHVGDCRNCYRYALHWREHVLAKMSTPKKEAAVPTDTRRRRPAVQQGDLFAELAGFVTELRDNKSTPLVKVPLADVALGMYGEVSIAWGPDGSVEKKYRRGFVTRQPRLCTAGIMGHSKGPKRRGEPLLSFDVDATGGPFVGLKAPMDATFTVMAPPAEHPKPRTALSRSRRLVVADLRRGDVFWIWNEDMESYGPQSTDKRHQYHVQNSPLMDDDRACCDVEVLVDGAGDVALRNLDAYMYVDVMDPVEVAWQEAAAKREPDARRSPRFPAGLYAAAGDGLDEVRAELSFAWLEDGELGLRDRELPREVWQALHDTLTGMGATGGSRKGQPYRLGTDRRADLEAFIAGGPAPKHERVTMGWVRTPDKLAAEVVARFADVQHLPDRVRVLEPSAGDGALVRAVTAAVPKVVEVTVVEPSSERFAQVHKLPGVVSWHNRTLEEYVSRRAAGAPGFDLIVMNPPYSVPGNRTLWIDHVRLAWDLLAEGGRLVAIVPGRPAERSDAKTRDLLAVLGRDVVVEALPDGSFRQLGAGFKTSVIAATKPGSVMQARQRYAASIYRPATGEPVAVDMPQLTAVDARERPVQAYRDWGGQQVARFVGVCIGCGVSTWSDGSCDPRGVLGMKASASLRAQEYDMVGPQVCRCWSCYDSPLLHRRTESRARLLWTRPDVAALDSLFDELESVLGQNTPLSRGN